MQILIADDDATSRLLLTAALARLGHTVTAAEDGQQALHAWREGHHSLVISDWMMPELDGLELCRHIRAEPELEYTYIVLLTSLSGKERYLDGMHAGADDFLTKPFDKDYLAARLHVAERILGLHAALHREATHDRLTGLWNRAAILDSLSEGGGRATPDGDCIGIILVDLDRFKAVNDNHGHAAGDSVLQEVARRMQVCLRPGDRIGRYGGEEFLIHLADGDETTALAMAELIRTGVSGAPIKTPSAPLGVTVSLGVAVSRPAGNSAISTLIAAADDALYRAKAAGRNRVEFAAPMDAPSGPCG